MQDQIRHWLNGSLAVLREQGRSLPDIQPQISIAKTAEHGDYTSNIALVLAAHVELSPHELARQIIACLPTAEQLDKVEVAGPGFINFHLKEAARIETLGTVIEMGDRYGHGYVASAKKILVEYVSANPTGPLHIGHGRGAAYGETIVTLLKAAGHQVEQEYYVNDAGRQTDILLLSAWLRYLDLSGVKVPFPDNAYQGDYIWDIAAQLRNERGDAFVHSAEQVLECLASEQVAQNIQEDQHERQLSALIANCRALLGEEHYSYIRDISLTTILTDIKADLARFGVHYDTWFSERSLFADNHIQQAIDTLRENGHVYQQDGALWYRSTTFGDDKDRVLQRSNGEFTYFASDIAYHLNKYQRGYDLIINIWGADHHGYVARLKAAVQALGLDPDKLLIIFVQFANLYRGEQKVSMSTRAGEFVTLKSLYQEVGIDATRFFYIMRKPSQHLDFDIELAKEESNNNPVYYVQYAHARICSVFKKLHEHGLEFEYQRSLLNAAQLSRPEEIALIKSLADYPAVFQAAADNLEPHTVLNFVREIATQFHSYYNQCQFLVDNDELRNARLSLLSAIQLVIRNSLSLFGVSAPEHM